MTQRKTRTMRVRITDQEWDELTALARVWDVSRSEAVRRSLRVVLQQARVEDAIDAAQRAGQDDGPLQRALRLVTGIGWPRQRP